MLIDIHAHAYRIKPPYIGFCTLPELLAAQERLGIDKSVILPIVSPEIYIPQDTADIIEMARQYPDRIIPFCNVDPRAMTNDSHAPLEELLEYYKEQGCLGVGEIMPNLRTDDPKVQNLFRAAEQVGLSVTYDGSDQLNGDFGLYDDIGLPQLELTLRRFQNLIVFGHGPIFWSEIAKLETPGERGVPFKFGGGGHKGAAGASMNKTMDEALLQVDHRIPYEIGGEQKTDDTDYYMLLSPSANRAKSWTCEHCVNWEKKDASFCMNCFWAHPENYTHIAGNIQRRITITFTGDEIEDYNKLIALVGEENAQNTIKQLINEHLK